MIACGLVISCGISHVCSEPATLTGVITLATGIVGGVFGHAGRDKMPRKEPPQ